MDGGMDGVWSPQREAKPRASLRWCANRSWQFAVDATKALQCVSIGQARFEPLKVQFEPTNAGTNNSPEPTKLLIHPIAKFPSVHAIHASPASPQDADVRKQVTEIRSTLILLGEGLRTLIYVWFVLICMGWGGWAKFVVTLT